ncbi:MAG: sulfatase/phosphatase domain-containing protein, partial [Paenisporosarcina sp.]
ESELGYLNSEIRNQIREAYDVDGVIQSMWNTLNSRGGVLGRTTWIFASDSGVFYEEQRSMAGQSISVSQKGDCYDCVTRTPSFIMGPGIPAGRTTLPMTLQDITPTILNILGGTATVTLRGTDIRTLISSPPADRDTLYECKDTAMPWNATGIVTKDRKLVEYSGKTGNDQYEMYLLDSDPNEYTNVANNPTYLTERNALKARLDAIP